MNRIRTGVGSLLTPVPTKPSQPLQANQTLTESPKMELDPRLKSVVGRVFSINVLSLYLFRRGVGLVLSTECCVRAALFVLSADGSFSFLAHKSETAGFFSVVEIALGISAIFLALGYHRTVYLLLTWALLLLRFYPDYGQTSYGFKILQAVYFWTLFLPSTDRRNGKGDLGDWSCTTVSSLASIGVLVQISLIYLSAGITKSSECWWTSGDALQRTIEWSWGNRETLRPVLEQEALLRMMTRLIFVAEMAAPVLILSPVKTDLSRTIAVGFFMSMHLGIAVLMRIGVFAYLCLATWLLFLPTGFWKWIATRRASMLSSVLPVPVSLLTDARPAHTAPVNSLVQSAQKTGDEQLKTASVIEEPQFRRAGLRDPLLCLALVYILATNLAQWRGASIYTSLRKIGYTVGLDQQWIMFNNPCKTPVNKS